MSGNPRNPHFVWIRTHGGCEPQKWGELHFGVNNRMLKDGTMIEGAWHEISEIAFTAMTIDELVKLFPPPAGHTYTPPPTPKAVQV